MSNSKKQYKELIENVQRDLESGALTLTINDNGNEIDIIEELSAGMLLLSNKEHSYILWLLLEKREENIVSKLVNERFLKTWEKYTVLNSTSCADNYHMRITALQMLRNKYDISGEYLVLLVCRALEFINKGKLNFGDCVDKCILATILHWAWDKNIISKIYEISGKDYFGKTVYKSNKSYEENLIHFCEQFGEVYYNFKTNKIDGIIFKQKIVSENGKLPIPKILDTATSPEYSWKVVSEIVGDKKLVDLDYSDEIKQAISTIFQCYYFNMYEFVTSVYEIMMRGIFYSINKDRLEDAASNLEYFNKKAENAGIKVKESMSQRDRADIYFRRLEYFKQQVEKTDIKLKEIKLSFRETRKQLENKETENNNLKLEIKKINEILDKLKNKGITDTEPYKKEILNKDIEIEKYKSSINEINRALLKKDNLIKEILKNNQELKSKLQEVTTHNETLNTNISALMNVGVSESIPIEYIVASMRSKNIVLFGGDMMHTMLKSLGFKRLRLVDASGNVNINDIRGADALVIITNYLSHASYFIPKKSADKYGTPILYFNGTNVNNLCKEMFMFFNNSDYKKGNTSNNVYRI